MTPAAGASASTPIRSFSCVTVSRLPSGDHAGPASVPVIPGGVMSRSGPPAADRGGRLWTKAVCRRKPATGGSAGDRRGGAERAVDPRETGPAPAADADVARPRGGANRDVEGRGVGQRVAAHRPPGERPEPPPPGRREQRPDP